MTVRGSIDTANTKDAVQYRVVMKEEVLSDGGHSENLCHDCQAIPFSVVSIQRQLVIRCAPSSILLDQRQ